MLHRRFHLLLLIILLSLFSIPAPYQSAQAISSTTQSAHTTAASDSIELVGSYGGWLRALAANGTWLYAAHSGGVAVFDSSNPNQPVRRGHILLPHAAQVAEYANGTVYVATAADLYAIDVTNPDLPTIRASYRLSSWAYNQPRAMQIAGDQLYLLYYEAPGNPDDDAQRNDLRIFDIGDPAQIIARGVYDDDLNNFMRDLEIVGAFVYITRDYNGVTLVNAGDPTNPILHSQLPSSDRLTEIEGQGNRLYIAALDISTFEEQLKIFDASIPGNPVLLGAYTSPDLGINNLKVQNNRAYIANSKFPNAYELRILDVSDPANVTLLGSYPTDLDPMHELLVADNLIYFSSNYFFWGNAIQVVDVGNPASPDGRGRIDTPTMVEGVDVVGTTAYVSAGQDGLFTFDVSDPTQPRLRSIFGGSSGNMTGAAVHDVHVVGNLAYLAANRSFKIVDVSNPDNPTLRSEIPVLALDLQVIGNRAYVVYDNAFSIIDISDPSQPVVIVTRDLTLYEGISVGMKVVGDRLYFSEGGCDPSCSGGFHIFDITNEANPVRISTVSGPYGDLGVVGNLLYVAAESLLYIYDVTNPASPTLRHTWTTRTSPEDLEIAGQYTYFAGSFRGGLQIADVSVPTSPKLRATFTTSPTAPLRPRTNSIKVVGDLVYVADASNGLLIFRVDAAQFPSSIFAPIVGKTL